MAGPVPSTQTSKIVVDYSKLSGSGPRGRIVFRDLEQAAVLNVTVEEQTASKAQAPEKVELAAATTSNLTSNGQPLSKMRRTIAKRMLESINTIPQFSI